MKSNPADKAGRVGLALLGATALCLAATACSGSNGTGSGGAATAGSSATATAQATGGSGDTGGSGGSTGGSGGSGGNTGGSGGGSTGGSSTSGGSTGGGQAAGVASCTGSQISVSEGQGDAGAGHSAAVILFHNTGSTSCSLYGYPGVAALDSGGQQVAQATRTLRGMMGGAPQSATAPSAVVVAPGATASARVEGTDVPEGNATSCPTYAGMLVTPPGTKTSTRLPIQMMGCSAIQVHPVVPGTTGDQG